jgi:hypothetical protein
MAPPAEKRRIVPRGSVLALAAVWICVAMATGDAAAQRRSKNSTGPRALGVIVFNSEPGGSKPGAKKKPEPWLIPITLWYEQRFFDATVYKATPRPMALDAEIVYEVQRSGDPVGLFFVGMPARLNGMWIGDGRYKTNAELEASAKRKPAYVPPKDSDEPPKLRRAPASSSTGGSTASAPNSAPKAEPAPAQQPAASDSPRDPDGPPRMKRPADEQPAAAAPASSPAASARNQTGTAGTQPPSQTQPPAAPEAEKKPVVIPAPDSDPNRPTLQRGAVPQTIAPKMAPPVATPPASAPAIKSIAPSASGAASAAATSSATASAVPQKAPEILVAISDAGGPEARPYVFHWGADEQARLTRAALRIAHEEILKYAASHYGLRSAPAPASAAPRGRTRLGSGSGAATPATPDQEPLGDQQIRAFDLEYDNYPELVLTGSRKLSVPTPGGTPADKTERTFYVALVLWADLRLGGANEDYRRLLAYVTDDAHLDQFPRLLLVDAVDADGDGIGELLFRGSHSPANDNDPSTWSFRLYRAGPDKLQTLFDSAGPAE